MFQKNKDSNNKVIFFFKFGGLCLCKFSFFFNFEGHKRMFHLAMSTCNVLLSDESKNVLSGGESHFLVTFSVEVTDGFLRTNLPSELINTTELKFKNIFRWQPIQTYAAISKHVSVKASGIRFRGTIKQCNDLMQELLHHVKVNHLSFSLNVFFLVS